MNLHVSNSLSKVYFCLNISQNPSEHIKYKMPRICFKRFSLCFYSLVPLVILFSLPEYVIALLSYSHCTLLHEISYCQPFMNRLF